jgi:flagellar assembly protein FliH
MQSSYNVIKNNSVKNTGLKPIVTSSDVSYINGDTAEVRAENESNARNHIESYENLARNILENARRQSDQIVARAYEDASTIESDAMQKAEQLMQDAYESGFNQGQEAGYAAGIEQARVEGEGIINSAVELLNNAKFQYDQYLQVKSGEIKELVLAISRSVLNRELQSDDSIDEMIYSAMAQAKNVKSFIIRCNPQHIDSLKSRIDSWKEQLGFFGDIFVLKDDSIEPGNAVIDKGNGKIIVGVDYALQRIGQILEGKD